MDQTVILQKAELNGGQVSVSFLRKNLDWEEDRSNRALDRLLSDGLAWVDTQSSEKLYWIPSIFFSESNSQKVAELLGESRMKSIFYLIMIG